MFKCRVCQKIYQNRVQYCDCGNDTFDVISQNVSHASPQKSISSGDIVSWVIFILCLVAAILVWFI